MKYALVVVFLVFSVGLNPVGAQPEPGGEDWIRDLPLPPEPGDDKWAQIGKLALMVERDPKCDLDMVSRHLDALFEDPKTNIDYFTADLFSRGALRNLVRALSLHAKQAYERGDWKRGERAFGLAFRVLDEVMLLMPPALRPIGEWGGRTMYVARGGELVFVTSFVTVTVCFVDQQLQAIAGEDEAYRRSFEAVTQRAKEISNYLRKTYKRAKVARLGLERGGVDNVVETLDTRMMEDAVVRLRVLVKQWQDEVQRFLRQLRPKH